MPNILAVHVQSAWVNTAIIVLDNRSGRKDASNYFNTRFDGVNTQIGDPKADIARVEGKVDAGVEIGFIHMQGPVSDNKPMQDYVKRVEECDGKGKDC